MKKPNPTPPTIAAGKRGERPRNVTRRPMASTMKIPPYEVGYVQPAATELRVVVSQSCVRMTRIVPTAAIRNISWSSPKSALRGDRRRSRARDQRRLIPVDRTPGRA
jgi:hypothetical protein